MSLAWIRTHYGVPAKRGMRITFDGSPATIVGAGGWDGRLRIRVDGAYRAVSVHPTWHIEYPKEGGMGTKVRDHAVWMADNAEEQVEQVALFLHANESLHMHENVGDAAPCDYCYLRAGKAIRALLDMAAGSVRPAAAKRAQCPACKRYYALNANGMLRGHRSCEGSGKPPKALDPQDAAGALSILEGRP